MSFHGFDLKDNVVIITGGAGLIGKEYVQSLSEAGAHPIVADLNFDEAQRVSREKGGKNSLPIQLDVKDPTSVKNMVNKVMDRFGRIDGFVNNAALDPKFDTEHAEEHHITFEDYPLKLWRESLDVNLTGMFLCAQAVAPVMLKQKKGSIVNISSIYGLVGPDQRLYEKDDPTIQPSVKPVTYSVTKSGVLGLTKYLATYWGEKGIRVNTLTLGGVFNNHEEEFVRRYSWRNPLGRMAQANEYCGALIFLLSDASSYMTGSNLVVDGGWTTW
jgi:NAD(P)-dependent dehydrogenase (short-subunit alcohol dehydrogenase family)